jgi:hypothetical protein
MQIYSSLTIVIVELPAIPAKLPARTANHRQPDSATNKLMLTGSVWKMMTSTVSGYHCGKSLSNQPADDYRFSAPCQHHLNIRHGWMENQPNCDINNAELAVNNTI